MIHNTSAILKCATHCEIQTLRMSDFYKTLLLFPHKTTQYRDIYKNRIEKAKIGLQIVKRYETLIEQWKFKRI